MKKILLSVAVLAFGYTAQAQENTFGFQEGDVIIEGNLGFSSKNDKNTEVKENSFNFNPKAGLFVSEKFAVGLELNLHNEKKTETVANVDNVTKGNSFYAGAFARYYFLDLGERFKTYTELGLGFSSAQDKINDVKSPKHTGFGAGLGLGVNYFVTPKMAINFGLSDILSFNSSKIDTKDAKNVSEFNGNLNVFNNFFSTATFGLTYKL